jgi:acyl carrier protein
MTRSEIFDVVKANVQNVIEGAQGKEITESNSMRDYGADSLEIVEVVSRSMKQLKLKVPRTLLSNARNLGDLVTMFQEVDARVTTIG